MLPTKEKLKRWARGRIWYFYLPLVLWYIYVFIRFVGNVNHEVLIMSLDLIFHEMGHHLFSFFGQFIEVLGGTIGQLIFPTTFLVYFYIKKEYFSVTFPLAWLAINFFNIGRYMADTMCKCMDFYLSSNGSVSTAPEFHDWEYLFSTLHILPFYMVFAVIMRAIGFIILLGILVWSTYLLWIMKNYSSYVDTKNLPTSIPKEASIALK